MIALLVVPVLIPLVMPLLVRRAAAHLTPVATLWTLTPTAVVLAGGSLAALGGLAVSGLLRVPAFALLGDLVHPLVVAPASVLLPVVGFAVGALGVCAWTVLRSVVRQVRAFRTATSLADARHTAGDLCVIDTAYPDAYALPGRPGRIVVTTGMLRSLSAEERGALLAHERAHLAGRHHYFLAAADLAAHCHPGLRPAREAVQLAAERSADEEAARVTGDRRLTARAIARAALAVGAGKREVLPSVAAAATSGPVPQRVRALLGAPRPRSRFAVAMTLVLALTAGLSLVTVAAGGAGLHHDVEVAQGERGHH
ncbi:M56 family metallopeptidase [Streptomyces sp. NBC_00102]|uniref:M56 family metallopeptidase n=1 Tax=Streptomyces sp. NBC_00102 TaxID=2975652 RepID=UPI002255E952|nr:M56 family metallopeptidase [Streptomyces sp. NBC_00102]MCX5401748.1 M56 family metallopeptidase [Streptomyces sp. NBC_00102]